MTKNNNNLKNNTKEILRNSRLKRLENQLKSNIMKRKKQKIMDKLIITGNKNLKALSIFMDLKIQHYQ